MGKFEQWEQKSREMGNLTNPHRIPNPMLVAVDELAPEFKEYARHPLMGGIYARPGLDLQTRALCTISALVVTGKEPMLKLWIKNALYLGCKKEQIVEVVQQMAFYGGLPCSVVGFNVAKAAFDEWDALNKPKARAVAKKAKK
ncbi:MAG: carboxymuconolactone decarboxylase family protein [Chloroflexi bacterium]|nr:carboxymuconolactone decarboxylase family protein [Chloroflexota bacterium]